MYWFADDGTMYSVKQVRVILFTCRELKGMLYNVFCILNDTV